MMMKNKIITGGFLRCLRNNYLLCVGSVLILACANTAHADFKAKNRNEANVKIARCQASIFLAQAGFGGSVAEINALGNQIQSKGLYTACEDWIDWQIGLGLGETYVKTMGRNPEKETFTTIYPGWIGRTITTPNQLRAKVAYSYNQIFVTGMSYWDGLHSRAGRWKRTISLYDVLYQGAFVKYDEILRQVSLDSFMGVWLTHNSNSKAVPLMSNGRQVVINGELQYLTTPDENYAREILQLFSMGVFKQNSQGDFEIGSDGFLIENYDSTHIEEYAQVFTGLAHNDRRGFNSKSATLLPLVPMRAYEAYHDTTSKELITRTLPAGQGTMQDLNNTMNEIASNPATAPYFLRTLMKRLTHSNPSSDYMQRVVDAWNNKGPYANGLRNMEGVIKAILLDPDVREAVQYTYDSGTGIVSSDHTQKLAPRGFRQVSLNGKFKDNTSKKFQAYRTLGAKVIGPEDEVALIDNGVLAAINNHKKLSFELPSMQETVFNFFSESNEPTGGSVGEFVAGWHNQFGVNPIVEVPEAQIMEEFLIPDAEIFRDSLSRFSIVSSGIRTLSLPRLISLKARQFWFEANLMDHLDIYFCGGMLPWETRQVIRQNYNHKNPDHVEEILTLIYMSPAFSVSP